MRTQSWGSAFSIATGIVVFFTSLLAFIPEALAQRPLVCNAFQCQCTSIPLNLCCSAPQCFVDNCFCQNYIVGCTPPPPLWNAWCP